MTLPRRRLNLTLHLGADDMRALTDALEQIAIDLSISGDETAFVTSGGTRSGFDLHLTCDESMDGDRYRTELLAYVARKRVGT